SMSDASRSSSEYGPGDHITIELTEMASGGRALGRLDGQVVFVEGGIAGERVRARVTARLKGYLEASAIEVLTPSPDRVELPFPALVESGGLEWQHLSYPAQLRWKEHIVRQQLMRFGGLESPEVRPTLGMADETAPWRYRAVAQFAVGPNGAI